MTAFAACDTAVLSGGYTVAVDRPGDQDKLIPIANFPAASFWTVTLHASANTLGVTLTVFAVCQ